MSIHRLCLSILLLFLVDACGSAEEPDNSDLPVLLTTIQPFAAILEPIAGEHARIERLLPSGASPHTYDPRPSDVSKASRAAAVFFGAAELDGWASRLGSRSAVSLFAMLPDSLTLPAPSDDHEHLEGLDPHFWTDPTAVKAIVPALADSLCSIVPPSCDEFRGNARLFLVELDSLHISIADTLSSVRGASVLLAHPFLQYFLHRYGLRLVGVIEELPGREPSPRDMGRIIARVRHSGASAIFTQPQLTFRGAGAVSEATGVPVRQLDPIGNGSYSSLLLELAHEIRTVLDEEDA